MINIEMILEQWLCDEGLKGAASWLVNSDDLYAEGYAAAVMSLCAALPMETIDLLPPLQQAMLVLLARKVQQDNQHSESS